MPSCLHRASHGLRLLALAVLALGLLVKPVLVAGCELEDMQLALGTGHEVVAAATDGGLEDECCPGQSCGECCTAGTVVPVAAVAMFPARVASAPPVAAPAEFGTAPARDVIRPPIAA